MFDTEFHIDGIKIGKGAAPYIIAELSGNHNGDIERAKKLISIARESGADAIKLQTYTADSLTINSSRKEFTLTTGTWKGRRLYELYQEAHTPWEWFPELFQHAKNIGISIFSSPFDLEAVRLLESIDCPAYKIASNEISDWRLLNEVINTGKPVILSTGTSSKEILSETVAHLHQLGATQVAILHCISAYPAPAKDCNLQTMVDIGSSYDVIYGLSDHTLGTATSVAAVALGASIIEKHITLDRNDGGPDSSFSLEPKELTRLCDDTRHAWESLGGVKYVSDDDLKSRGIFTRQFWTIADIRKGDRFSDANIKSIRAPVDAGGLSTRDFSKILGKMATCDIPKHHPVDIDAIDQE